MSKKSREYVLKRLDEWYYTRYKRAFRKADAKNLEGIAMQALDSIKTTDLDFVEELRRQIPQMYSRNTLLKKSKIFFSGFYYQLETSMEADLSIIPEGIRNEYFQGVLDVKRKLDDFVNCTRQKAEEVFPNELSDEHINEAFLQVFGGLEGYITSGRDAYKAVLLMINYLVASRKVPQALFDFHKELFALSGDFLRNLSRRMFSQIK
ncbi:hypothetical protein FJZ19_05540 [Candidatus Pacearchaeota archaeon]|nr:hypothetical protein [Candidatus Pacearchaeota archaeon]